MEEEMLKGITNAQDRKKIQNRLAQRRRRKRCLYSRFTAVNKLKLRYCPGLRLKNHQLGQDITMTQTTPNPASHRSVKDMDKNIFTDLELDSAFGRNSPTELSSKDQLDLTTFSPRCNEGTIDPFLFRESVLGTVEEARSPTTYGSENNIRTNNSSSTARTFSAALEKPPSQHTISGRTMPIANTKQLDITHQTLLTPHGRFSRIFEAMKEAGFATFDEMATSYYTCSFPTSSAAYDMQRQSRIRHFGAFLSHVKTHAMAWSYKEQYGWAAEILVAAEELCAEEIQTMIEDSRHGGICLLDSAQHDSPSQITMLQEQVN